MKISEIMTKDLTLISAETSVLDAAKCMKESNCGILPIGDKEHVSGVVTDRDIVMQAVVSEEDLAHTPVKQIMTDKIYFCNEDDPVNKALQTMNENNVRRVLVLDENKDLTGILSLMDIISRVENKDTLGKLFQEERTP